MTRRALLGCIRFESFGINIKRRKHFRPYSCSFGKHFRPSAARREHAPSAI